jgi:hypothetical protein
VINHVGLMRLPFPCANLGDSPAFTLGFTSILSLEGPLGYGLKLLSLPIFGTPGFGCTNPLSFLGD